MCYLCIIETANRQLYKCEEVAEHIAFLFTADRHYRRVGIEPLMQRLCA